MQTLHIICHSFDLSVGQTQSDLGHDQAAGIICTPHAAGSEALEHFFSIDGMFVLSGGQQPDVFLSVIDRLAARQAEVEV